VATLAICIVFFPVLLLEGPARFLFTPLALAVVFSMLASYLLSRTLVPTLARMLLARGEGVGTSAARPARRLQALFLRLQDAYGRALEAVLRHRRLALAAAGGFALMSGGLYFALGQDFFPGVDAGLMNLHLRAPAGTRLEATEKVVAQVEQALREIIPAEELRGLNSNVGTSAPFTQAFIPSDDVSSQDADLFISLADRHHPTAQVMARVREELPRRFPGLTFYFQPADLVSQVLNFGVSTPIDLKVQGMDLAADQAVAGRLEAALKGVPGVVDIPSATAARRAAYPRPGPARGPVIGPCTILSRASASR
jgi:multidrug efflux pump subunit AcrB